MLKIGASFVILIACVACGSSFTANEGESVAGSGNAGESTGGQSHAAGNSGRGDAGTTGDGGSTFGGDAGGSNAGSAGSAGSGGASTSAGAGGSEPVDECARIKQQYQTAVEKARVCDEGSTNECSPSSTVEPLSCGCPVLVNARSEFTSVAKKARQAYLDAHCVEGVACAAIACAQPVGVSCAPAPGSGKTFVCSALNAIAN